MRDKSEHEWFAIDAVHSRMPLYLKLFLKIQDNKVPHCATRHPLVFQNYSHLFMLRHDLASEEQKIAGANVSGFSRTLSKLETYFLLKLLTFVSAGLETASAALRKAALRFHQAENIIKAVRESLSKLRNQNSPDFITKHKQGRVKYTSTLRGRRAC